MCCSRAYRPLFNVINALFVLAGAAVVLLVTVVPGHDDGSEPFLTPLVYVHCPQCSLIFAVAIGVGGFIAALGLVGACAAVMRSKLMMIVYKLLVFLLFLVSCAYIVLVVLLRVGVFDTVLSKGWNAAASASPSTVCNFMAAFECNGWFTPVCSVTATPDPFSGNQSAACAPPLTACGQANAISRTNRTCAEGGSAGVRQHFALLLTIGGALVACCVVLNFIAFCVKRGYGYLDESDDDTAGTEGTELKRYYRIQAR